MNSKSKFGFWMLMPTGRDRLAILGFVLLAASVPLQAAMAADYTQQSFESQKNSLQQLIDRSSTKTQLLAQAHNNSQDQRFLEAYGRSKYSFMDAALLAKFWNEDIGAAKTRIGSKLMPDPTAPDMVGVGLDQDLVDARLKALAAMNPQQGLTYWQDSNHTYDDAVALAKLWGEKSPWDAKIRVEKNLILGNEKVVNKTVEIARKRFPSVSQEKVPTSVKLSLQCGIQPGANGKNRIPLNRVVPAFTVQHLDMSPAIYLDVDFADGSKSGPHDYQKNFASNVVFDDQCFDPKDLIQVVYWDVDNNDPSKGKFGAQVTSTGLGVGIAYLKVSFRNAPNVIASIPVEVTSGTGD